MQRAVTRNAWAHNAVVRHATTASVILFALGALAACASAPAPEGPSQPALARLAQPYAAGLAVAGITALDVAGRGVMVRAATQYGAVYTRYPEGVASVAFALRIAEDGVEARAAEFDAARMADYARALQAIVAQTIPVVERNNRIMFERANPER
jgi:hypothetical protein